MRAVIAVLAVALIAGGAGAESLMQGVKAEKRGYDLGEKILFEYAIRNNSDQAAVYRFSTSKQFDLWVSRGGEEVFRLSRNKVYIQMMTTLALRPGETKSYSAEWDQKDLKGRQVGPGTYTVYAQLTPSGSQPLSTTSKVQLGSKGAALVPVSIKEAITSFSELSGKRVLISAFYRGFSPDPSDPNTKDGPPISRSDWAICDGSGSMYAVGTVDLDPAKDVGVRVSVVGRLKKNSKGQVYLVLESVNVLKKACGPSQLRLQ